jgi:hypothetical protein
MLCNSGRGDDENQEETEEQQELTPEKAASINRTECARTVLTSVQQLTTRCNAKPADYSHLRPSVSTVTCCNIP